MRRVSVLLSNPKEVRHISRRIISVLCFLVMLGLFLAVAPKSVFAGDDPLAELTVLIGDDVVGGDDDAVLTESNIRGDIEEEGVDPTKVKIKIDLNGSGFTWASDAAENRSKRNLLFDNLTTSGKEKAEWAKVIGNLKATLDTNYGDILAFESGDDPKKVLTITLPPTPGYDISADQEISVSVPSSLLQRGDETDSEFKLDPTTFTIKTDEAANITGSITGTTTAADIRKGGKTIIITLVNPPGNAVWNSDIEDNIDKREALFSALKADEADVNKEKWNRDVINALKASATIVRTNESIVTIKLPPVPTYNIDIDKAQTIQLSSIPADCLTPKEEFTPKPPSEFTITPMGSTAAITGTIIGNTASPTSEANIVDGGCTITYTLTNDIWAFDIATNKAKYEALFSALKADEADDDKAKWAKVIDALKASAIVRTNDRVVTITLPPVPEYDITASQTITASIPSLTEPNGLPLVESGSEPTISSTFTIYPVTAAVSGTAVTRATIQKDIVSGGKTIIITLSKGSTWETDIVKNPEKLDELIDGIRLSAEDTVNAPDAQWDKVRTALKTSSSKIKVSGSVLTITLPPVADYFIEDKQTVMVKVAKDLLKLPTFEDFEALPTFMIYPETLPPATASISFDSPLSATAINEGSAKVIITLHNDTWVGDIDSNKNNLLKLLDGFTAATDTAQWEKIKTAVKNGANALSKSDDSTITITIPEVGDYNIAKDQVISLKIPKDLLNLTKSDLTATPSLTIKAKEEGNLEEMLDGGLDALLENHSPANIYVNVPKKYINIINMANSDLSSVNFTSLDVNTEEEVQAIKVTADSGERTVLTYSVVKGKRVFSVAFSGLEMDSDITVTAFSDTECTTGLGKEVTVKVAAKNTTPYPSTKNLAGSYSLQELISNSKVFNNILQQYDLDELTVTASTS